MTESAPRAQPLSLFEVPLSGQRLVEASAGTGKTYTIAGLFLRLVVEAGFAVDRVLVVTYTNAATAELRTRIRSRLVELRAVLRGEGEGDDVLRELCSRVVDAEQARRRVDAAVLGFDTASVHTIHAFCQRALAEHAFASGVPFDRELVPDPSERLRRVVEDFWRREVQGADEEFVGRLLDAGESPTTLMNFVRPWLGKPYLHVERAPAPADDASLRHARDAALADLRATWEREAVVALLGAGDLNRRSYSEAIVGRACAEVEAILAGGAPPSSLSADVERLTPARLQAATKKGGTTPSHPFFHACEALHKAMADLQHNFELGLAELRLHLLAHAREALEQLELERREHSYDDLLLDLDRALDGAGGARLATALRERYPAALVDEFQDTDPVQYRIFRRIYADTDAPLYLVGDPKQAIYAFRGADVFAYLHGQADAMSSYTLEYNWRSGDALVRGVNALFGQREDAFVITDIGFTPARAAERDAGALRVDGDDEQPLRLWHVPKAGEKPVDKGRANEVAASATAAEIARLLDRGADGTACIVDGERERPLAGGDIAVLVPTHRQGSQVREQLRARGIASVQLSGESVFATAEALELERLLLALAEPGREALVRAALLTDLMGGDGLTLQRMAEDECLLDAWMEKFDGWHRDWRERGLQAALRALFEAEGVRARLLSLPDGERRLTNLLHLVELQPQAQGRHTGGVGAAVKWLAARRQAAAGGGRAEDEVQELRLESDQNLVNIVTIHRSKGLQYPVVFCPFLWDSRQPAGAAQWYDWHDPGDCHRHVLDLGSPRFDEAAAGWRLERRAEAVRLAYVALTRAQHRCYLLLVEAKGFEDSALGWLLGHGAGGLSLRGCLDALQAEQADALKVQPVPDGHALLRPPGDDRREMRAREVAGPVRSRRVIGSFSSLARGHAADRPDHDAGVAAVPQVQAASPAATPAPDTTPSAAGLLPMAPVAPAVAPYFASPPSGGFFDFPRGARAGTCLHAVFEQLDFVQAARTDGRGALEEWVTARLRAHGYGAEWTAVVADAVQRVLATPLAEGGTPRLAEVARAQRLDELEFYYPVKRLAAASLFALMQRFGLPVPAEGAGFAPLAGHLKGYVDLVFEAGGRWYLVDYKSNWLGAALEDYRADALEAVMTREAYHLQYLLYTLALHRWLALRVPGYDYERHFGGVFYLFLRGMSPQAGPRTGIHATRPPLGLVRALDEIVSGEES